MESLKKVLSTFSNYYLKDKVSNTLVTYALIKVGVLVPAIIIALKYTPEGLFYVSKYSNFFLARWDGNWYIGIAHLGYHGFNYPASTAFAPLYPLLIKVLSGNNFAFMPFSAVLIANAFSFLGLYFLYKLVPLVLDEQYRLKVCFAYMVFPILTLSGLVAYSESIFLAFTIGSYYFWKTEKYLLASLLAVCSIFTRQLGILIIVIFVVDTLVGYVTQQQKSHKRILKRSLVLLTSVAGAGAFYLFYYLISGNPFILIEAQSLFKNSFSPLKVLPYIIVRFMVDMPKEQAYTATVPLMLLMTISIIATALFFFKKELSLSVYAIVQLVVYLSMAHPNSFFRWTASIFPIYLFFGYLLFDDWRKNAFVGILAVAVVIQNMYVWITGGWVN
jgi:hypothetical protein